jgi:hypothetical protein
VRIEVALDGGQILSWLVTPESADALERALGAMSTGTITLESEDGSVIILVVPRVLYAKRFAREARVGFEG